MEKLSHVHMILMLSVAAWGVLNTASAREIRLPPPGPIEQQKILDEAAAFVVKHDTAIEQFTYFDRRGGYQVVARSAEPVSILRDRPQGAFPSGGLWSLTSAVFSPQSSATFSWQGWKTIRGVRTYVFTFQVPASRLAYHIELPNRSLDLTTPYHGLIFVDSQNLVVRRITLHADEIPPSYPIQDIALILDYDWTENYAGYDDCRTFNPVFVAANDESEIAKW